eukprot:Nitzschia sp. Nitz4//scaffold7_size249615//178403//179910//NITZ4_001194-RA/size249615-augustus-gene-0.37-mRNA-1//-1//CDS//3329558493//6460//frame0
MKKPLANLLISFLAFVTLYGLVLQREVLRSFLPIPTDEKYNWENSSSFSFSTSLTPTPATRKWAYAFLIGGCQTQNPQYRGFLYNVVVSKYRLEQMGSQADVVVMIQMSVHTNETQLPDNEVELLEAMNITIRYLPKFAAPVHEVFYGLVFEKFRILEMTEYSRVLFLDGDVVPICNLDYLFELSEPEYGSPLLKENAVLAWKGEAANAGFFMFQPNQSDFQLMQEVIRVKEEKALQLPFPHWDEVEGWGHKIEAPDFWRSPMVQHATNWSWHAVFADQGLLYHWTKYVKMSVSLMIGDDIENWSSRNGTIFLENVYHGGPLSNYSCSAARTNGPSPYVHFHHFTGSSKPWEPLQYSRYIEHLNNDTTKSDLRPHLPTGSILLQWYETLDLIEERYGRKVFNFSHVLDPKSEGPPVGRFSAFGQMFQHLEAKAARNWSAYQFD